MIGRSVVAEGYSLPDVRQGDVSFPVRWLDDRTFSAEFAVGRHDATLVRRVVRALQLPLDGLTPLVRRGGRLGSRPLLGGQGA